MEATKGRVLVIGSDGMLGQDVCARFAPHFALLTASRRSGDIRMDITDSEATRRAIEQSAPDVVILCAAYTDVDGCERNPQEAYRVNAFGAANVASVCAEAGASLVYISTDYVFDGAKCEGYTEWDTPHPLNVYGASKLVGEQWVREVCPRHWIVRTAWLYGVGGRCFPRTILNVAREGKPLRVVNDQTGSPTFTWDLAGALLEMVQRSVAYGTYHVVNEGAATWYQVACEVIRLATGWGLLSAEVSIEAISSREWHSPTRRPAYSVLNMERLRWAGVALPRHWREALQDYIQRLHA
ncbi:MAG: dTDP-4-dehydrorhamnose reductase [Armatimonadota bacterium]|nr:dTDP-4-dehydrorhamnose reductase [bacterium]MDW8321393.1 dTDP-4-dehydrorhamnose reductase [Armatimonadota bacterium]